jgi:seryl-tRNA synthetase
VLELKVQQFYQFKNHKWTRLEQLTQSRNKLSKEVDEMKKTISMFAAMDAVTKNSSKEPDGGEDAKAEKKDKSKRVLDSLKTVEPRTRF